MSRRGWWLIASAVVLVLTVEAGVAAVVWQHVRPRLPALATVTPTLDRAVSAAVTDAGDSAAVAVSDLVPATSCQNTPFAKGSIYTRSADLYTTPGGENPLVARIAAALPDSDHPQRGAALSGGAAPLSADLPGGIRLQVDQIGEGWVAATAKTNCRAAGHPEANAGAPPADTIASVTDLLTALGTTPASWHTDTVACAGGRIVTVDAISQTTTTSNLPTRLAAQVPAGARRFTSTSNRLAWRTPTASTIVAASDDGTHITVQQTTTC
ncbi:hypothetical protein [Rugosimonospora africana]|uniref:Uncharacterized protein n=1 Tax=Rugosimonospora africana TaxID=556532 RepID=A0A8J3VRG7_9ACTN|nr:hypothetical protein [Rugosimonospora africana]GIH15506.1 hypothetical protein Raf01_36780 [Rugosimonospora africana]